MRGLSTEEASLHQPPSGTSLEADSLALDEASGWLLEARISESGTEEGQGIKE